MGARVLKKTKKSKSNNQLKTGNKDGYDLSEFVNLDIPVRLNPNTGKLEAIEQPAPDQSASAAL